MSDRKIGVISVTEYEERRDAIITTSASTNLLALDWSVICDKRGEEVMLEIVIPPDCFTCSYIGCQDYRQMFQDKIPVPLPSMRPPEMGKLHGMGWEVIRVLFVGGYMPETQILLSDGSMLMAKYVGVALDVETPHPDVVLTLRLAPESYRYEQRRSDS